MDGVANALEHAQYCKALFELEEIQVKSLVEFGFGMGHMLESFSQTFHIKKAYGIEPSEYIFEKTSKRLKNTKHTLMQETLFEWCHRPEEKVFDLGICNSVFQYIKDKELPFIVKTLAKRVKFLYFSVPTNKELRRQVEDFSFDDKFAKKRSKKKYLELIQNDFTIVSSRILESKKFYNEKNSPFSEFLFRLP